MRAQRARRKRRRRNIILGVLLTVILLTVGIVLSLTVFFKISAVTVTGDEVYSTEQVVEASGITQGENLFLLKKSDTAALIEKTLPYVETADISKSLSGTITIHITAAKAVAALDNGDSFTLLNASGKVLEDGVAALNDGVMIVQANGIKSAVPGEMVAFSTEEELADMTATYEALQAAEIAGITELDVRDHLNIKAVYQGRITLELGAVSSLPDKTSFIKAALTRNDESEPEFEGTIDFTIDKKAYVRPKEETTAPVTAPATTAGTAGETTTASQSTSQAPTTTTAAA